LIVESFLYLVCDWMKTGEEKYACMVGRFQPFHLGHERVVQAMIDRFGMKNCLLLVGSSTTPLSEKNIFSYEERKIMIQNIFPKLVVIWLADFATDEERFVELGKLVQEKLNIGFDDIIFYAWIEDDIPYFVSTWKKYCIIERNWSESLSVSWSQIRVFLKQKKSIENLVNQKNISLIQDGFGTNYWSLNLD